MLISINPENHILLDLIEKSPSKTVKWLEDAADQARYFWAAEDATHAHVASILHIVKYSKGIAVP